MFSCDLNKYITDIFAIITVQHCKFIIFVAHNIIYT